MSGGNDKPFAQEGYDFMAAVFEVHKVLGGGLGEEIYQQSLQVELGLRGIPYDKKHELLVYYKGHQLEKKYIPDLYVFDRIVVELKSVSAVAPEHEAQLINYMRITRRPVGYLVNFGPMKRVEWKRFVCSEYLESTENPLEPPLH